MFYTNLLLIKGLVHIFSLHATSAVWVNQSNTVSKMTAQIHVIVTNIHIHDRHTALATSMLSCYVCCMFFRHVVCRQNKSFLFLEQSVWCLFACRTLMFSCVNFRNLVFWLPGAYWSWSLSARWFSLALNQAPKEF